MSRAPSSASAYEAFPAQEFDAWVDKLRHTIIDGLEEPDLAVPPVVVPTLSNGALEAVRQADLEVAEAEAKALREAQAREEEARLAAQQQLGRRREMLAHLQQRKQQLEDECREQAQQERAREELEPQGRAHALRQREEEARRQLQVSEDRPHENPEVEYEEDAEYDEEGEEEDGFTAEIGYSLQDQEEQVMTDEDEDNDDDTEGEDNQGSLRGESPEGSQADDDGQGYQESDQSQTINDVHTVKREGLEDDSHEFEEDEDDTALNEPGSSRPVADESEPEEDALDWEQSQDEGQNQTVSYEGETAAPQGFRRTYATVRTDFLIVGGGSPNQEEEYDEGEDEASTESGQEDDERESGEEPSTSRQPVQSVSYSQPLNEVPGDQNQVIEFIDDSEDEESTPPRSNDSASASGEDDDAESPRSQRHMKISDEDALDCEQSSQEESEEGDVAGYNEGEYDDHDLAQNQHQQAEFTDGQRRYDNSDDGDEDEDPYGSEEEEGVEYQGIRNARPYNDQESHIPSQESREDELAEDNEDEVTSSYTAQHAYMPQRRHPATTSDWEPTLVLDPALQSGFIQSSQVQEMVQVSSHGLAINGMLQAAASVSESESRRNTTAIALVSAVAEASTSVATHSEEADMMVDSEVIEENTPHDTVQDDSGPLDSSIMTRSKSEEGEVAAGPESESESSQPMADTSDAIRNATPDKPQGLTLAQSTIASLSQGPLQPSASAGYQADDGLAEARPPSESPSGSTSLAESDNSATTSSPARVPFTDEVLSIDVEWVSDGGGPTETVPRTRTPTKQEANQPNAYAIVEEDNSRVPACGEHVSRSPAEGLTERGTISAERESSASHDVPNITDSENLGELVSEINTSAVDRDHNEEIVAEDVTEGSERREYRTDEESGFDPSLAEPRAVSMQEEIVDLAQYRLAFSSTEGEPTADMDRDEQPFDSGFDHSAEFVGLATPSERDELEDGEIREDDEANTGRAGVQSMGQDAEEAESQNRTGEAGERDQNEDELDVEIGLEVDYCVEAEEKATDDGRSATSETQDERDSDDPRDTPNPDDGGLGPVEVMGSQVENVRADEIPNIDEDYTDSQQDPDYTADESPSAEEIQYDSDDAVPRPIEPEPEIPEVDPENIEALRAEIRSHDRNDIPHKNEHLKEEDEEYDDDEPQHHVDGRPAGYENYEVVEETDPRDLQVYEIAERNHAGIEGDRTTEQMMIEEMDLRQQPGDAIRATHVPRHTGSSTIPSNGDDQVMPRLPSVDQVHNPNANTARKATDIAGEDHAPQIGVTHSPRDAREGSVGSPFGPTQKEDTPTPIAAGVQEAIGSTLFEERLEIDRQTLQAQATEEEDMFNVESSYEVEMDRDQAERGTIVALLQADELPPAPQHDRSPSPLAPEAELHHDIALAMEPMPLLHRHDHHHNVVLEESHRIHEEKLQSFTSAIASVQESSSSLADNPSSGQAGPSDLDIDHSAGSDRSPGQARQPPDEEAGDTVPSLPTPPMLESEQETEDVLHDGQDDDDDPLRLRGPFTDHDSDRSTYIPTTEVYVELPIVDRYYARGPSQSSHAYFAVEQPQSSTPTTPVHPVLSAADPTRHHHGPGRSTSASAIRNDDLEVSGSPAAHTRSQCHYHKIRFGRGVFSHVLLIPHCSIGSEDARRGMGASDLGRVTKEEMSRKRDLHLGEAFTNKMTSDVETLPDELEHQVKQLAGAELLREGHIWLLPLADVAPQSMINRSFEDMDNARDEDVFHVRSSPRVLSRVPSQTPDRKRKRGSSHTRSISASRSEGGSPDSASIGTRSRTRAGVVRKVSQIDENDEDAQDTEEGSLVKHRDDGSADQDQAAQAYEGTSAFAEGTIKEESMDGEEDNSSPASDITRDPVPPEKRANDDEEVDGEGSFDGRASKKRIIEREDGEGRNAVDVKPAPKAGWLSWFFGRK